MSFFDKGVFSGSIDSARKSFTSELKQKAHVIENSVKDIARHSFNSSAIQDAAIRLSSVGDIIKKLESLDVDLGNTDTIKKFLDGNGGVISKFIVDNSDLDTPFISFDNISAFADYININSKQTKQSSNQSYIKSITNSIKGEYGFSVDDFMSSVINTGLARSNRYWVQFFLPSGIPETTANININSTVGKIRESESIFSSNGRMSMRCINANMPSRTLMTVESKQSNLANKLPYSTQFDDATFIFNSSTDMLERKYFQTWMDTVINMKDNSINFYNEYTSTIIINQLDEAGNPTYTIKLIDAYPINLGSIDYSYANMDSITPTSVTFSYKKWIVVK